jgi:hypothetical protein
MGYKNEKKVQFKAHQMYFYNFKGDQFLFRVDHVRSKNKILDVTILAQNSCVGTLAWRSIPIKSIVNHVQEVFKKDLPLYIHLKSISDEFTKILRG